MLLLPLIKNKIIEMITLAIKIFFAKKNVQYNANVCTQKRGTVLAPLTILSN